MAFFRTANPRAVHTECIRHSSIPAQAVAGGGVAADANDLDTPDHDLSSATTHAAAPLIDTSSSGLPPSYALPYAKDESTIEARASASQVTALVERLLRVLAQHSDSLVHSAFPHILPSWPSLIAFPHGLPS